MKKLILIHFYFIKARTAETNNVTATKTTTVKKKTTTARAAKPKAGTEKIETNSIIKTKIS